MADLSCWDIKSQIFEFSKKIINVSGYSRKRNKKISITNLKKNILEKEFE